MGGGRAAVDPREQQDLRDLQRALDRLNHEYAAVVVATGVPVDVLAGQVIGTSALIGIRARMALGTMGPTPFGGELDDPRIGVLSGLDIPAGRPSAGVAW